TYLKKSGYLKPIIRGWYYQSHPADRDGDTTTWYAGYWEFIAKYLQKRFANEYCLNPEISLLLHTKNSIIPKQIVVVTKKGSVGKVELLYGTSIFIYPEKKTFPTELTTLNGLNVFTLEEALCKVGKLFYQKNQNEVEIALGMVKDVSKLLHILLIKERMDDATSRICGALKFVGREDDALRIKESYEMATFKNVSLQSPFTAREPILSLSRERNPYALRLKSMWQKYRVVIIGMLKEKALAKQSTENIMAEMDEKYQADAYHSLSIEGYKVTLNLINKVANGNWSPEANSEDEQIKNALAAKGYYLAFEAVKKSIVQSVEQKRDISSRLSTEHHKWYQELFTPTIRSGILEAYHLAGYRNHQVYLRGSSHVPFPKEAIVDAMEVYFELLEKEENPMVQAILGHHMFGFIHPYMDGNGRMARFIMNAILVSNGYPWLIIKVEERERYMNSLEEASVDGNIEPFAGFILESR
nr:Fic family protein [Campylobacterota bacterium]